MKTSYKLMLAGLALMFADIAYAGATLHDVETAVKVNKDYRQAERLIREVVANDPDNARDHYVYSQILRHNGKHDDAVHELLAAKRLDPAITFDRNPGRVAAYQAALNAEGGLQPAQQPRAEPQAAAAPAAAQALETEPRPASGLGLIWAALILGAVGVAGYFFYRRVQEQARLENEERVKAIRQEQLKQASALLELVKPLKLDIRMANPANLPLLAKVDDAESELVNLIERLEKLPVAQYEIERLADTLAHLRRVFEGKPDPAPLQQSEYDDARHMSAGNPAGPQAPGPQPFYGGNNSGGMGGVGGLMAGLALGSLMSGGHEREVIREIREAPARRNDSDDAGAGGQSDIDFGNDSDGGGVDFGGSDDS